MINGLRCLAIIPARGGSKGLPGKNIYPLLGKPLIQWTLEASQASSYIDHCVVSTDSPDIAAVVSSIGGNVPFLRPSYLAQDNSTSVDTVHHAIGFLSAIGLDFDCIILLEPTSPLRSAADIDHALEIFSSYTCSSLVSVSTAPSVHPAFQFTISNDFLLPYASSNPSGLRRQDTPMTYFLDGSIYISSAKDIYENSTFISLDTIPFIMPFWKSFEIDSLEDLLIVESIMNNIDRFSTL